MYEIPILLLKDVSSLSVCYMHQLVLPLYLLSLK